MPQFDHLVELIESGKSFLDACDGAKLCGANAMVSSTLHDLEGVALKRSNDDVTCEMCEAVAGSIFSLEKYNKQLIPMFKMGLEVLCDRFQTPQVHFYVLEITLTSSSHSALMSCLNLTTWSTWLKTERTSWKPVMKPSCAVPRR